MDTIPIQEDALFFQHIIAKSRVHQLLYGTGAIRLHKPALPLRSFMCSFIDGTDSLLVDMLLYLWLNNRKEMFSLGTVWLWHH